MILIFFFSHPLIIFGIPSIFTNRTIFPNCLKSSSKSPFGQVFDIFKSIIFNPLYNSIFILSF